MGGMELASSPSLTLSLQPPEEQLPQAIQATEFLTQGLGELQELWRVETKTPLPAILHFPLDLMQGDT